MHRVERVAAEGRVRRSTRGGAEGHLADLTPPAANSDPNPSGSALNSDPCTVSALNSDPCIVSASNSDLE